MCIGEVQEGSVLLETQVGEGSAHGVLVDIMKLKVIANIPSTPALLLLW